MFIKLNRFKTIVNKAFGFSPTSLFASGEQGVWYDPSDFTTMFQDSAGTTPVTAVEQPVGLLLDKSKGLVLGSELLSNTGNPFTVTTGWSNQSGNAPLTVSSGNLLATPTNTASNRTDTPITTVVGKWYSVTINIVQYSSSTGRTLAVLSTRGGSPVTGTSVYGATGITRIIFLATTTTTYLTVGSNISVIGVPTIISSASVKELAGNHASQSTTTKRPVLSARYNQLVGTTTLATQSVTTQATDYILSFTGAGSITLSGTKIQAGITEGNNTITGVTAGTLTLTVVGTVTNAQLIPSNQSTIPYQQVTTSTNYDSTASNFPPYLKFDGVDDSMETANINFSTTDKVSIFAGLRKNNSVLSLLCEITASSGTNNNAFGVFAPRALITGADYAFTTKGTLGGQALSTDIYPSPITNTLAAFGDISGDSGIININGVNDVTTVIEQGTGNYSNAPLYIGARNQTSLYFNGNIYSLIIRGASSTATQITNTETYVNSKTKAY